MLSGPIKRFLKQINIIHNINQRNKNNNNDNDENISPDACGPACRQMPCHLHFHDKTGERK